MDWKSTFAAFVRDERLHAAAIGLAAFGIVSTMLTVLAKIRDANEITPVEPKTQYITQETEDALPNSTLDTLLQHPNVSIRDVATRILCDRAINNKEILEILLHGLAQEQYEYRIKSLRALNLLMGLSSSNPDYILRLHKQNAYHFIVCCLEHCLNDCAVPDLSDSHWDEYQLRDKAEKLCLALAYQLCSNHGARKLAKAGFVEKWLAKQDWGTHPEMRVLRFAMYMGRKKNRIVEVVNKLRQCHSGMRALRDAKLLKEPSPNSLPNSPRSRQLREGSVEQRRLRRQHREAMVLNDGTRPLGQADIIERDHDSPA
ncbi:hypothetical protein CDD81_1690 [Ophiocordyceps australis]|uniref:Armadillo repeat-containing domain-containing protein n=1 Tax=Ophiocordyceps australis TaxID=1399860 RepID=A0A2C5XZL2_9HYPO|nr:hypothetical protein CDD81_1690 [Ophiocordyceps australis]